MKILKYGIIFIVLICLTNSCNDVKNASPDLAIDYLNIWVKDPSKAKKCLTDIGFTSVPDSLSAIHEGQGTTGRYFNFLNGYLELIFVNDQEEFEENNEENKQLDFIERANFDLNEASPFSIALKVKDYKVEKIPFKKVRYHQDWMEENPSIFSAENSKLYLNEPSTFVVYPGIKAITFETVTALENTPSEDSRWKNYFRHPNGAKRITNIVITAPGVSLKTETIRAINSIEHINVKISGEHVMELYFDNQIQGKTFDLRPALPLMVYL